MEQQRDTNPQCSEHTEVPGYMLSFQETGLLNPSTLD